MANYRYKEALLELTCIEPGEDVNVLTNQGHFFHLPM